MDYVVLLGFVAGSLTTFSYVPELLDTMKTKDTKDISVVWLSCLGAGMVLWTYYGYLIDSMPLLVLSAISFVFIVAMFALKMKYK